MCERKFIVLEQYEGDNYIGSATEMKEWLINQASRHGSDVSDFVEEHTEVYELVSDKSVLPVFTTTITMEIK